MLPNATGNMALNTGGCDFQIDFKLLQQQSNGTVKPIAYWYQFLSDVKFKYDTVQQEYLAIVWSLLSVCPHLCDERFTVRTNHSFLMYILNLTNSVGRLVHWRLRYSEFDIDIVHRTEIKHQALNALSC